MVICLWLCGYVSLPEGISKYYQNSFRKLSMYGIFPYIYHTNQPNVGKYTIHGWCGFKQTQASKPFSCGNSRSVRWLTGAARVGVGDSWIFHRERTKKWWCGPQKWSYCWWLKSCTSWFGRYPIVYRVLYIPGGAGFCPSTVLISINIAPILEVPWQVSQVLCTNMTSYHGVPSLKLT